MRQIVLLLWFFSLSTIIHSQQTLKKNLTHDNQEREYILYIPASYTGDSPVPLLFNFHGYTSSASDQMAYGNFRTIANTEGFIVVHPQGSIFNGNTHWNVGGWTIGSTADDIGFTEAMLDALIADYNIDETRIYSTGFSNGGYFSFRLACELKDRFAAVASVGGSITPLIAGNCNPKSPMPILQIHGTDDGVINYNGGIWSWSIFDLMQYWTGHNNGDITPKTTTIPDNNPNDGSTVEHLVYEGGDRGTTVEHFKVIGGKHTWPGTNIGTNGVNKDINASEEIWKFFSRFDINGKIGTTSLEDISEDAISFILSPNPVSTVLNIKTNTSEILEYHLLSISGEILISDVIHQNSYDLDLSELTSGMYILSINEVNHRIVKL